MISTRQSPFYSRIGHTIISLSDKSLLHRNPSTSLLTRTFLLRDPRVVEEQRSRKHYIRNSSGDDRRRSPMTVLFQSMNSKIKDNDAADASAFKNTSSNNNNNNNNNDDKNKLEVEKALEELSQENIRVYQSAVQRTLAWVAAACLFGVGLLVAFGPETGEEFFAGYLVEQSLSVDNLFVFLLLFEYFKVPLEAQDRVLNWGIIGAIVMRAVMIGLGAAALQNFHEILLVFAGILVYSSVQALVPGDDDDKEEDPSDNAIVKFSQSLMESTQQFDGDRFFTLVDGVKKATPLFICMVAVEISDVVFAVDSIPAVFGVTEVCIIL